MLISRTIVLPVLLATALLAPRELSAAVDTYVSLGDSLAFGYTDGREILNPSFGDQGYVRRFADGVAARNGGSRPEVLNLGIASETTSSYFLGGKLATFANLNYTVPFPSQSTLFVSKVAANPGAVTTVSISLGSNNLFELANSSAFQTASPDQRAALLGQTLADTFQQYARILTDVRTLVPRADLLLLGPYNPFSAVPTSPFAPFADPAVQALNAVIADLATRFEGTYIDLYSAFIGHEVEYTNILSIDPFSGQNNIHPNDRGYEVIAGLMLAATTSVPEPDSLILAASGSVILMGMGLRRRSRA